MKVDLCERESVSSEYRGVASIIEPSCCREHYVLACSIDRRKSVQEHLKKRKNCEVILLNKGKVIL